MSITELIKRKRFAPGKGVIEPPPQQGVKRFIFVLVTHPWKLIYLNLLFLAFSIPVLTIPASLCGMNRVLIKLVREGNCFLWHDFIKEFKENLFKSLPFGILSAFLLFSSYYFLSLSISADGMYVVSGAIGVLFLVIAFLFSSYVFVFLPSLNLKNRHIARNAFILMVIEWKTNLALLCSAFAMAVIIIFFFPHSIFLLLFIWFSLMQLIVCTAINLPLEKRIIGPYEMIREET